MTTNDEESQLWLDDDGNPISRLSNVFLAALDAVGKIGKLEIVRYEDEATA